MPDTYSNTYSSRAHENQQFILFKFIFLYCGIGIGFWNRILESGFTNDDFGIGIDTWNRHPVLSISIFSLQTVTASSSCFTFAWSGYNAKPSDNELFAFFNAFLFFLLMLKSDKNYSEFFIFVKGAL